MAAEQCGGKPSPEQVYRYFSKLGLELRRAFKMHAVAGLWERTPEYKRDWGNVSEHCLVEAARADVLSDLLSFSSGLKGYLRMAAAVSDYFKRREKEITRGSSDPEKAFARAEAESHQLLKEAGFSDRIIYLADSTGTVESILKVAPDLLEKENLTDEEIAYLALHYIDDYTVGSDWVTPVEILSDGTVKNAFDKRMDDLDKRYPDLKASGFNDKQRNVGFQVEKRLAEIISQKIGEALDPKQIPEMIDQEIVRRIQLH